MVQLKRYEMKKPFQKISEMAVSTTWRPFRDNRRIYVNGDDQKNIAIKFTIC